MKTTITERLAGALRQIADQSNVSYAHDAEEMLSDVRELARAALEDYDAQRAQRDKARDERRVYKPGAEEAQ